MITSKQRAFLRSLAMPLKPNVIIGKGEVDENLIREISLNLDANEIVKISILQNSDYEAKELINELAKNLFAEPVSCVGRKIVLYRRSNKKGVKHIELPNV